MPLNPSPAVDARGSGAAQRAVPAETPPAPATVHPGRTVAWLARQADVALSDLDLSISQYRLLALLDAGPAVSSFLADHLAVRRPSVTAVVDGLVARGLVARRHVEDDRRCVAHVLTPEGTKILAEADRVVEQRLGELAAHLPEAALARRALDDLQLWQQALVARRLSLTPHR